MSGNETQANIGVVGLAVMGSNLARNLASREGNTVAIFNRSYEKTQAVLDAHPEAGFIPAATYEEFAAALSKPRTAIIMVKAGAGTDAVIDELVKVFEPGDIIVGDADGVIVLPPGIAEEVVAAALAQEEEDAWVAARVAEGNPVDGLFPMNAQWRERYESERS